MCLCKFIFEYIREHLWDIIQTCIGFAAIYFANKIANKQIKQADDTYRNSIWDLQINAIRHQESWERDDLNRGITQTALLAELLKESTKGTDEYKEYWDKLKKSDALVGLAKKKLGDTVDLYNRVLAKNPMGFEVEDNIKTIYSENETLEKIIELTNASHVQHWDSSS